MTFSALFAGPPTQRTSDNAPSFDTVQADGSNQHLVLFLRPARICPAKYAVTMTHIGCTSEHELRALMLDATHQTILPPGISPLPAAWFLSYAMAPL